MLDIAQTTAESTVTPCRAGRHRAAGCLLAEANYRSVRRIWLEEEIALLARPSAPW